MNVYKSSPRLLGIAVAAVLAAWSGLAIGAAGAEVASRPPGPPTVTLQFDQQLILQSGYRIDWREVSDSRCPKNVTCVWAGEVTIRIAAWLDHTFLGTYVLALRPDDPAAAQVTVGRQILRLLKVEPYPVLGRLPSRGDYRAVLAVPIIDPAN